MKGPFPGLIRAKCYGNKHQTQGPHSGLRWDLPSTVPSVLAQAGA